MLPPGTESLSKEGSGIATEFLISSSDRSGEGIVESSTVFQAAVPHVTNADEFRVYQRDLDCREGDPHPLI
jgi:hypothetical protein